ncbi:MAG: ABC transporter ATP-binding protein [Pseudomonadota bacterium]
MSHAGQAAPPTPSAMPGAPPPALELRDIDKHFGAVHANRAVSLVVRRGSIHGIVGENGAGKSTLMRIVYGFYQPDAGLIHVDGAPRRFRNPREAMQAGIGMVHQHFMLVAPFTVLENVVLGLGAGALLRPVLETARARLLEIEARYGLEVDIDARVCDLSVGERQRVEILKALYRDARILILDEPTGVLTPQEAEALFAILRGLRAQGRSVLLITHKLKEIMAVTDQVSVMRAGAMVAHRATGDTSREELAELMVGAKVAVPRNSGEGAAGPLMLSLEGVSTAERTGGASLSQVSLGVHAGEILGIAGVAGNGQSALMEAIAGMRSLSAGVIRLGAHVIASADLRADPLKVRAAGIAHVPEDCQTSGLVAAMSAAENTMLGHQANPRFYRHGLLDTAVLTARAARHFADYDIRPRRPGQLAGAFSGGNQQKIVLAREIEGDPAVLLVGQPTRGVDIGAVAAIHRRLLDLRARGKAILLVSADLDELLALADRILVMFHGRIVGEARPGAVSEQELGLMMAGGAATGAAA